MQHLSNEQIQALESQWLSETLGPQLPLQQIFHVLPIAISFHTLPPNSKALYLNSCFTQVFGYTLQDLPLIEDWIGLAYENPLQREASQQQWLAMVDQVKQSQQQAAPNEFNLCCQDGVVKNILIRTTMIGDFVLSSFVDITDFKHQEEELFQLQKEYIKILDNAPIAIASYNLKEDPDIIFMNKQSQELFAYTHDDVATVSQWFQAAYPDPNYRQEVFEKWQQLISRQQKNGQPEYLQCKVTNKYRQELDILFSAIALDNQIVVSMQDLTSLKTIESELDQARQTLEKTALAITEAIPVGTYTMVKKPDQPMAYFSFLSDRFLELTGLEREEAISDPLKAFACVHPDDYDAWIALNAACFSQKSPFYGETRIIVKGEVRWISAESIPRDLPDGSTVWEGVLIDITKTKRYEEELKQANYDASQINKRLEEKVGQHTAELEASRSKFQRLLDDIGDKFVVFSHTDSIVTYVSNGVENIFGITAHEILGKSWITSINWLPESLALAEVEIAKMLGDKVDSQLEVSFIRPDGQQKILNVLQHGVWDQAGNLVAIEGLLEDITERKAAIAALEASEAKYRSFIETANDIIYSINREGFFTYLSPNLKIMLGFDPEEIQGIPFPEMLHPDDVPHCQDFFNAVMSGQRKRDLEYRVKHKDGSWRWHMTSASPQFDEQGQVVAFLGFGYDITDRKLADLNQQRLNEELIKASRLKDEFLAMMSHELRTPLNAILGMTESLQENIFGDINPHQENAIKTIEKSGQHLLSLINDILDVAKIEAGKIELYRQDLEVRSLCESSLTLINTQAQKKQIQLKITLPFQLPRIYVDEGRMRQVLINLLNNAVKFTPEQGQVTLEVIYPPISEDQAHDHLRFAIQDTGIGIAPEHQERLFQPFVQIDSALSRQHEGTGLGLVLVKKIVDLHGGKVGVVSEVGVGSCFTVDVPVASASFLVQTWPHAIDSEPESVMIHSSPKSPPLIMLAEDNPANVMTITTYFKAKGYRLITADNGEDAVHLVFSEKPDIIIMDIQMPKLNGIEAITAIRANPEFQHTPIIALTALVMEGDREKCLDAGANQYISKPVSLRYLWETIEHLHQ